MAEETTVVEKTTLDSAITEAANKVEEASTQETKETPKESKEEKKEEEKKDDLTSDETAQAVQLFKALKNPEHAPAVIKFLAEQAGYSKIETKAEAKEAKAEIKDDIKSLLEEHLGEEFKFLADRFAPAIDKIIDKKLEKGLKEVKQAQEATEQEKLAAKAERALTAIAKEHYDAAELPDDVYAEMQKLMDKYGPGEKDSIEDYLKDIFFMVIGKKGVVTKAAKAADKVAKNRSDVASRLASGGNVRPSEAVDTSKKMTLDEAVRAADEQLKKE